MNLVFSFDWKDLKLVGCRYFLLIIISLLQYIPVLLLFNIALSCYPEEEEEEAELRR